MTRRDAPSATTFRPATGGTPSLRRTGPTNQAYAAAITSTPITVLGWRSQSVQENGPDGADWTDKTDGKTMLVSRSVLGLAADRVRLVRQGRTVVFITPARTPHTGRAARSPRRAR